MANIETKCNFGDGGGTMGNCQQLLQDFLLDIGKFLELRT